MYTSTESVHVCVTVLSAPQAASVGFYDQSNLDPVVRDPASSLPGLACVRTGV